MRFLLRPSWLAFIAVIAGFVVACYALLAPWQFGREAQREAQQQAIDASYATPPVPLGEIVAPGEGASRDVEWRRVTLAGSYLPAAEALVRLQVVDGRPAVEVLTPFRTDGGRLVTVDRGSVTAQSGGAVPAIAAPPAEPVSLTARVRLDETDPKDRGVSDIGGYRQLYAADSRALRAATGLALEPGFLQLEADQPGVLTPLAVEPSTGGAPFTNLSYALQWLTFGAIALFAMVYFVRLELLQRRSADPAADRSALRRALAGEDEPATPPASAPNPGETPLSDRYGRR